MLMAVAGAAGLIASFVGLKQYRREELVRHRMLMLAGLLGQGQRLLNMLSKRVGATREMFHLVLDESVGEWIAEVEDYLQRALGPAYVPRFRQDAVLPDWGAVPFGEAAARGRRL